MITWRAAGPTGTRLYLHADTIELDAPALDAVLAHLATERQHLP